MKISIIGYKNHSLRLKTILNDLDYNNICNFNYHTDTINKIEDSDVFFIATPNDTHVDWIKKLEIYNKYIFCEKPPATNEKELSEIEDYKEKIYFNFNYRFSSFSKIIKKYNINNKLGSPVYINCVSTHGLAFKDSFKDNWRFNNKSLFSSIVGNLGIHYIDLLAYLFGEFTDIDIKYLSVTSKNLPDTCKLTFMMKNCFADVLLSYATPFTNRIYIIYDNGIVELVNGEISLREPRDCYDENGYFASPKKEILKTFRDSNQYYNDSLSESIKYFFSFANNDLNIPKAHYIQSIESNRLLLNL